MSDPTNLSPEVLRYFDNKHRAIRDKHAEQNREQTRELSYFHIDALLCGYLTREDYEGLDQFVASLDTYDWDQLELRHYARRLLEFKDKLPQWDKFIECFKDLIKDLTPLQQGHLLFWISPEHTPIDTTPAQLAEYAKWSLKTSYPELFPK